MPPVHTTEPFVVKRRGLGTTKTMLLLCAVLFVVEVVLTLLCVVAALIKDIPIRQPLEQLWLSWGGMPLIFALGVPFLLLIGAITAFEERQHADENDVLLSIDETGIHLGGDPVRTIAWADVRGVCRIERHDSNTDGGEWWEPHLVVLLHDDNSLPRNSKRWGPSCPWPGAHEILGKSLPYDDLVAAVARYAPGVPVTDRGRVPD